PIAGTPCCAARRPASSCGSQGDPASQSAGSGPDKPAEGGGRPRNHRPTAKYRAGDSCPTCGSPSRKRSSACDPSCEQPSARTPASLLSEQSSLHHVFRASAASRESPADSFVGAAAIRSPRIVKMDKIDNDLLPRQIF